MRFADTFEKYHSHPANIWKVMWPTFRVAKTWPSWAKLGPSSAKADKSWQVSAKAWPTGQNSGKHLPIWVDCVQMLAMLKMLTNIDQLCSQSGRTSAPEANVRHLLRNCWTTSEQAEFAKGNFSGRMASNLSATFGQLDHLCHYKPLQCRHRTTLMPAWIRLGGSRPHRVHSTEHRCSPQGPLQRVQVMDRRALTPRHPGVKRQPRANCPVRKTTAPAARGALRRPAWRAASTRVNRPPLGHNTLPHARARSAATSCYDNCGTRRLRNRRGGLQHARRPPIARRAGGPPHRARLSARARARQGPADHGKLIRSHPSSQTRAGAHSGGKLCGPPPLGTDTKSIGRSGLGVCAWGACCRMGEAREYHDGWGSSRGVVKSRPVKNGPVLTPL